MRASPRISVLGEGGDPCIADNGPSEDHKTVIFPGDGFPLHRQLLMCVSLTMVAEPSTDSLLLQQETVSRVDQPFSGNATIHLRASHLGGPLYSLGRTCCSLGIVLQLLGVH